MPNLLTVGLVGAVSDDDATADPGASAAGSAVGLAESVGFIVGFDTGDAVEHDTIRSNAPSMKIRSRGGAGGRDRRRQSVLGCRARSRSEARGGTRGRSGHAATAVARKRGKVARRHSQRAGGMPTRLAQMGRTTTR